MGVSGSFEEVDAPRLLVSTEQFDDFPGPSTNTLAFCALGEDRTAMTLSVVYPTREIRDGWLASGMTEGLGVGYDRLDVALADAATDPLSTARSRPGCPRRSAGVSSPSWTRKELACLLFKQDGVIARWQALAAGATDSDIERRLRRREWARVSPGVYVDHTGPLTWRQRAWAAVLAVWPAALDGHRLCDAPAFADPRNRASRSSSTTPAESTPGRCADHQVRHGGADPLGASSGAARGRRAAGGGSRRYRGRSGGARRRCVSVAADDPRATALAPFTGSAGSDTAAC